ncbi:MAG: hypothetical protein EAY65_04690 [Alphaproteobacteria bacterium]|nr:MAG: hypothetical protein EAY65_04690 [Alphaproteobacteria bacterium]
MWRRMICGCIMPSKLLTLSAMCMAVAHPLYAETSHKNEPAYKLEMVRKKMKDAEAQRDLTLVMIRHSANAMKDQRTHMQQKVDAIHALEREVERLEDELTQRADEEAVLQQTLTAQRRHAGYMISAAWSLHNRPQIAAFMLPEDARHQALTSRALHMTTVGLKKQMRSLNEDMVALEEVRAKITDKKEETQKKKALLDEEREQLFAEIKEQQQHMDVLSRESQEQEQRIAKLAQKATSLEALMQGLEQEREVTERQFAHIHPQKKPEYSLNTQPIMRSTVEATPPRQGVLHGSFVNARGRLRLPVQGRITGRYGQARGGNDRLKGIEVRAVQGGMVSAPFAGEVLYVGKFLEYGNMVIIRHSKDYHTLLAGLQRINVTRGQKLLDGTPVGVMGHDTTSQTLYLELRHQSKVVDPMPWFARSPSSVAQY